MSTPTHYATYQKTDDHIIIKFKDIEIARTTRPVKLQEYHEKYDFEPVYYIPLSDIHQELLRANQRATNCPIKGKAQYWDLEVDGLTLSNVMWSYPEPLEHAQPIKGYAAFDQKKGIELVV